MTDASCPLCAGKGWVPAIVEGGAVQCPVCGGFGKQRAALKTLAEAALAVFPRCKTCAHWNELESDARDLAVGVEESKRLAYAVGYCEHPHIRTQHERESQRADSASYLTEDPTFWFWPAEDFGCVLHSDIDVKTRKPNDKHRLKISGDFAESVAAAMKKGVPNGDIEPVGEPDGPPFTDEQAAAIGRSLAEHRSGRPIVEVDTGGDL